MFQAKRQKTCSLISLEIREEDLNLPIELTEKKHPHTIEEFLDYISYCLTSFNEETVKYGILKMRKVSQARRLNELGKIDEFKIPQKLMSILERVDLEKNIIYELTWILVNLSSVSHASFIEAFISEQAFSIYQRYITHQEAKIRENIVWILGNIGGEGIKYRNAILSDKTLFTKLCEVVHWDNPLETERQLAFCFSVILRGKPEPHLENVKACLEVLELLFKRNDSEIKRDCMWGISSISDSDAVSVQRFIIDKGFVNEIVLMDRRRIYEMIIPAIRIIGNLVSKTDKVVEELFALNVVSFFEKNFEEFKESILLRENCWVIGNMFCGPKTHLEYLLKNTKLYQAMVSMTRVHDKEVRREAVNSLNNLISGADIELILDIDKADLILTYIDCLKDNDAQVLLFTLEGLGVLFSKGELIRSSLEVNPFIQKFKSLCGLDLLARIQTYKQNQIYNKTSEIIENYFKDDFGDA